MEKRIAPINVLLAEDNVVSGMLYEQMLKSLNCRVVWVKNGLDALKTVQMEAFDIAIIDRKMPVMDGPAFTKHFRQIEYYENRNSPLKIIAISAAETRAAKQECLLSGMDDYYLKPLSQKKLETVLYSTLKH